MILEACAALAVLGCIIAAAYLLTRPKGPVSVEKTMEAGNTVINVRAKRDVRRIEVCGGDGTGVCLVRAGLRNGEEARFSFPVSRSPVRITVEDDAGSHVMEA
jgi:hypothetical protein